jgi:hypothetical protein
MRASPAGHAFGPPVYRDADLIVFALKPERRAVP